jgi:hypothetical protein
MEILDRIKKIFRFDKPNTINKKKLHILHTMTREELIEEAKKYVDTHKKDKK